METLASAQLKAQNRDFGMVVREVDEDLAIYLGMRSSEEEGNDHLPVQEPDCSSAALPNSQSPPEKIHASADKESPHVEMDKIDYDWLLSEPHTSLHPSVETRIQDSAATLATDSNNAVVRPKYKPAQSIRKPAPLNKSSAQVPKASSVSSSATITRKPLSSGGRTTGRASLPAKSNPPRPSTPTLKAKLPPGNPSFVQERSKTPSRSASHSSTSVDKDSVHISSKPPTKLTTPIRKPSSAPSNVSSISKSSAGRKNEATTLKNPVPSSLLKSRPSKSSDMLTLSLDAPKVVKPSMPKRPASASRERQSAPTTPLCDGKSRQKSCSPSRVGALFTRSRGRDNGGSDEVNPVLMGTKMVERVVSMRKLAPPKEDACSSHDYSRKTTLENSGFGRSLSKKSLDMAIRHMDIRRSISDNARP